MKKFLVAMVAALSISALACTSVESAKVDPATIAANGEAVAVVQATTLGLCLIFHFVPIVESNLDTVINKVLVAEAKALGGNKVDLKGFMEMPHGSILFQLFHGILLVDPAFAEGVVVK
ncbi:MAG: hypothetical protein GY822_07770 [Deltaproteobacteria bacterium]|nr:hypothetical protein [Deltaproteobacteria bacterium]